MHATIFVHIRLIAYHEYSPSQLVLGKQPNISHLRIFGCIVYVPIAFTQSTKMGLQRKLGIYIGFDSLSIIRYFKLLTEDVFTDRFAYCHLNESVFSPLGGEKFQKNDEKLLGMHLQCLILIFVQINVN